VNVWYDTAKKLAYLVEYLSRFSGYTGPIFAIFSPYESALGADDRSVPYFRFIKGRRRGNQIMLRRTSINYRSGKYIYMYVLQVAERLLLPVCPCVVCYRSPILAKESESGLKATN